MASTEATEVEKPIKRAFNEEKIRNNKKKIFCMPKPRSEVRPIQNRTSGFMWSCDIKTRVLTLIIYIYIYDTTQVKRNDIPIRVLHRNRLVLFMWKDCKKIFFFFTTFGEKTKNKQTITPQSLT